jgi:hypothetical protein
MNRWAEYNAGTLTPPAVVQHDQIGDEHLIWVWDGARIRGPFSRATYDEQTILGQVQEMIESEAQRRHGEV